MKKIISKFSFDETGASAIEYALIASLIAVAIITATTTLGTKVASTFGKASAKM
jgi:pilus assembly protein Flp/PilA